MVAAPGQQVPAVAATAILGRQRPIKYFGVEFVQVTVFRQRMRHPDAVRRAGRQRLGDQVLPQRLQRRVEILGVVTPHGRLHRLIHFLAGLHDIRVVDHGRVMIAQQQMDLPRELDLQTKHILVQLERQASAQVVFGSAVENFMQDQVRVRPGGQIGKHDDPLEVTAMAVNVAGKDDASGFGQMQDIALADRALEIDLGGLAAKFNHWTFRRWSAWS